MPFLIITTRPDDDLRAEVKRHAKDTRQEERAPAIRGDQRMAYLMREHLRRLREQLEAAEHVSRRAVAALEEARKACLDIVRPLAREALKRPAGDPIELAAELYAIDHGHVLTQQMQDRLAAYLRDELGHDGMLSRSKLRADNDVNTATTIRAQATSLLTLVQR